jgi:hypothetical protein
MFGNGRVLYIVLLGCCCCMPQENCEKIVGAMNSKESFNKVVLAFPKVQTIDVCRKDDSPQPFLCRTLTRR